MGYESEVSLKGYIYLKAGTNITLKKNNFVQFIAKRERRIFRSDTKRHNGNGN